MGIAAVPMMRWVCIASKNGREPSDLFQVDAQHASGGLMIFIGTLGNKARREVISRPFAKRVCEDFPRPMMWCSSRGLLGCLNSSALARRTSRKLPKLPNEHSKEATVGRKPFVTVMTHDGGDATV